MQDLSIVTRYVLAAFSHAHSEQYEQLGRVFQWRVNSLASQKAMAAVDPGMWFEGRKLQFNRFSWPRFHIQDPDWGSVIIVYYGTLECCTPELRQLNMEVILRPGDQVMFRSKDVLHEVEDWASGERHLLVHFTHKTLWDQAKVRCKSGPAVWVQVSS